MGLGRVELPTSRLSGVRSNHLSYRPLPEGRNLILLVANLNCWFRIARPENLR